MKIFLVILTLLLASPAHGQTNDDDKHNWSDNYEEIRKQMRTLEPDDKKSCEGLLRDILKYIDDNISCNIDSDCTLIDQHPFVLVVIRADAAEETQGMIIKYDGSCQSDSYEWMGNDQLIHEPKCWNSKCMVQTRPKR